MFPYKSIVFVFTIFLLLSCRPLDMYDQPKYEAYEYSEFFPDGRSVRPPPEGTVAQGHLEEDQFLYRGRRQGELVNEFPFPIQYQELIEGKRRYEIFCVPCHGYDGQGDGMIVLRGYLRPPAFTIERLRQAPLGHFFDVITNGIRAMPPYGAQIPARDRWMIVAYLKSLQLSQWNEVKNIPESMRRQLEEP